MHRDWSVWKLLEGRDVTIKSLVATVSFAVEPQKANGGNAAGFSSKHLLQSAKDLLRLSTSFNSSSWPPNSAPHTHLGKQPLPPLADTPTPEMAQLSDSSHRFWWHFFSLLLVTAMLEKLKSYLQQLSLNAPLRGSLQKRAIHLQHLYNILNTFWPIRLISDDVRCSNIDIYKRYDCCRSHISPYNMESLLTHTLACTSTKCSIIIASWF